MVKRRKLEAPSAEDLSRIEEEFRRETSPRAARAPIAQVAADAAAETEILGVETRARLAEAEILRAAQEKGLVLREIPVDRIRADELVRDRTVIDRAEMEELRASIVKNGLRLPIEVYQLAQGTDHFDYGLISGYRRLQAVREAMELTEDGQFSVIKAIVRAPEGSAQSIAAMVEENEVRAGLSHFERGRIAALSAQNGVFASVEEAVNELFPFASKAKRSKVRSFALVFEEIGDVLTFPEALTEKQGLTIATALRAGGGAALRGALAEGGAGDPREEWTLIETALSGLQDTERDPARGGRPTKKQARPKRTEVPTNSDVTLSWEADEKGGFVMRLGGDIDHARLEKVLEAVCMNLSGSKGT